MIKLNISSLEFEDIKTSIKEYYKKDTQWTDYNFEGSAISSYLNILAYNTHYMGYYIKMLLNEAFTDTSQTKEALISKAKQTGYIAKGKSSAYASLKVLVENVDPAIKFITIPAGTTFNTTSTTENKNIFHTTTDFTIKNIAGVFETKNVIVQQGNVVKNTFLVKESRQRLRLADLNCDVNTIKLYVKSSENSRVRTQYNRVDDIIDIKPDSKVWYVVMSSSGVYDIYFGEDRFGYQPKIGEYVDIEFMSTNGANGNNVKNFTIAPSNSNNPTNIGFYKEIKVTTIEPSHGGTDAETVEDLRFSIPNHNRRQKRVVNENDYRSVLLSEFRDVESITVWGGEKNLERMYAKMFVSIKPKNSDNLSETAKTIIRQNLVKRYGIIGSNVIFMKPEFINLDLTINVKLSKLAAIDHDTVESDITQKAELYNNSVLNRFDTIYSDAEFINYLKEDTDYITSIFTQKILSKKVYYDKGKNTRYHIIMGNPISNVISEPFEYGLYTAYLKNNEGYLYVYNTTTNKKLTEIEVGTIDFESGDIYFDVPRDVLSDSLTVICNPMNPDIETYLNNIVRFSSINVKVT